MAELSDEEILRRFRSLVAQAGLDDVRDAVSRLAGIGRFATLPPRPSLRMPSPEKPRLLRIRASLKGAEPPIWRRLEIRGDATLDVVHRVLQTAFGWGDTHRHRFALGGSPFERDSELFLCASDVDDGDEEGTADADVRLDETVQRRGDRLEYVYDEGHGWQVRLRVEGARVMRAGTPIALCTGGRRLPPPEDGGGHVDLTLSDDELAELDDEPVFFDADDVNAALGVLPAGQRIDPGLTTMIETLRPGKSRSFIVVVMRVALAETVAPRVIPATLDDAYRPVQWFLDRAADGGIPLTAAGYVRPPDVAAIAAITPGVGGPHGDKPREVGVRPVLRLRRALQRFGLLEVRKGRVVLTSAGEQVRHDPELLRTHLVEQLRQPLPDRHAERVRLLTLLFAATARDQTLDFDDMAEVLTALGRRVDDTPALARDLCRPDAPHLDLLRALSPDHDDIPFVQHISPVAAALAHRALYVPHAPRKKP